jgi:hypothetical protein
MTPKKPGQGYCAEHQSARVKKNYLARKAASDPEYQHPKDRTNNLVADIRSALANGMPLSPERIRELFLENALPSPSFEQIQETFFPDEPKSGDPRDEIDYDAMQAELDRINAQLDGNPYDPS